MNVDLINTALGSGALGGTLMFFLGRKMYAFKVAKLRLENKQKELDIYKDYDSLKNDRILELSKSVSGLTEKIKKMEADADKRDKEYKYRQLQSDKKFDRILSVLLDIGCWTKDCKDPRGPLRTNKKQLNGLLNNGKIGDPE